MLIQNVLLPHIIDLRFSFLLLAFLALEWSLHWRAVFWPLAWLSQFVHSASQCGGECHLHVLPCHHVVTYWCWGVMHGLSNASAFDCALLSVALCGLPFLIYLFWLKSVQDFPINPCCLPLVLMSWKFCGAYLKDYPPVLHVSVESIWWIEGILARSCTVGH